VIRTDPRYEQFLGWGKRTFQGRGKVRAFTYETVMHGKRALKGLLGADGVFTDLGLKYMGPVDGHNLAQVEEALRQAKLYGAPVIVHVLTDKGRGYTPAEQDDADRFHAVGRIHPETGLPIEPSRFGWTSVFADEMLAVGAERDDVVGITAAMLEPVGLGPFAREYPDRVIDVGIAEQHAVTSAAGLAFAGLHPVIALYATFLNRAFDQVLMDVALHHAGVTFMLDRAGITGDDGASHNGMWDMALLRHVPGMRIAAPRDEPTLRAAFREALDVSDAPTVVRYPKGALTAPLPALRHEGGLDILAEHGTGRDAVVLGLGPMAATAVEVAGKLAAEGFDTLAATATWVHPVPEGFVPLINGARLVITVEDGLADAGMGEEWGAYARSAGVEAEFRHFGVPSRFLDHGSRTQVIDEIGLDAGAIADFATAALNV
jgi:1-deoxy-D-xylulose-5-phosphate synthase